SIPVGGRCAADMHLVNRAAGAPGIAHLDPAGYMDNTPTGPDTYNDADYVCVPNQRPEDISCGAHGQSALADGVAACVCAEGYGGATCNVCAQGYEDGGGVCTLADVPELKIEGIANSFVTGETRVITPTGITARSFDWRVLAGGACFEDAAGGCASTFSGLSATVRAPSAVTEMQIMQLAVKSVAPEGTPPFEWEINTLVMPAEQIPVSGYGDSRLLPVIRYLRQFMQQRCVGAATFGISRNGVILGSWTLGRQDGPAASKDIWDADCGDPMLDVGDLADPEVMDTPFLIGSNSKYHTSAVLRWVLKTVAKQKAGLDLTDAQILGMKPFDPDHYPPLIPGTNPPVAFPVPIVPEDVYRMMAGLDPLVATLADSASYGAPSNAYPLCDGSTVADGFADPQWRDVTIGHIVSHQTGMQRSAPRQTQVVSLLPALRSLTSEQDFIAQEQILRTLWGNAKVTTAESALNYPVGVKTYVLPRPTLPELIKVLAGRCLRYPLGFFSYSNTSPALSTLIIDQVAGRYVAQLGDAASHIGSALQIFLQNSVGIATTSTEGIFAIQPGVDVPGYTWPGPRFRDWNGTFNNYYYLEWDSKQPHCVWDAGASTCSFSDWTSPTDQRGQIRWSMNYGKVPFIGTLNDVSPGTGSLMVEARDELRFLAKYQIGSYGDPASVGRPRAGQPNASYNHNGSLGGGYSFARQLAASTGESMNLPPLDAQGNLTDDYLNLASFTCPSQLPDGVDYIVALNQNKDRKCVNQPNTNTSDPNDNLCLQAYAVLDAVMRYGICQVNWAVVPTVQKVAIAE
ncbi:MAG: hypothetical protein KDD84_00220, partial [Caldilineaceae bacterium]|nr:hypothetical protein [Caldilineaceae bacterium]